MLNGITAPDLPPNRVVFSTSTTAPQYVDEFLHFRKQKFVDVLGWQLSCNREFERDEFDTLNTVYCGLYERDTVVGGFRAIRTDLPYLAATKFPELASDRPYPRHAVSWEISRLGVMSGKRGFGRSVACYAAMFHFAQRTNAFSLVAFCDLGHERLLQRIGIRTNRFGEPATIGSDEAGRPVRVVAGEIVLAQQDPARLALLTAPIQNMDIDDAAAIFGRQRLSA